MTTKEIIAVEREVYEAVLRNSVRVNNLESRKPTAQRVASFSKMLFDL